MNGKLWIVGLCLLGLNALAQVQSVPGKGEIDWNKRVVIAKGIGAPNPNMPSVTARPMAIRAARQVALRNALELIKGLQVTSNTTVENFMITSDVIRSQVEGYIQAFKESEPKYLSDKTIEILVEIPMDEKLAESLLPASISKTPSALIEPTKKANSGFTGLIIDARGIGVIPALVPKIVDESGKEVYGSAFVSRDWAVKWGMSGYAKSIEQAAAYKDRIGAQPGVIKGVKALGASKTDIVISNADAESIRAASKSMKFLSDCRIVIVVD